MYSSRTTITDIPADNCQMVVYCDHPIQGNGTILQHCLWKTVINVYPDRLHSTSTFSSVTWIPGPAHISNDELTDSLTHFLLGIRTAQSVQQWAKGWMVRIQFHAVIRFFSSPQWYTSSGAHKTFYPTGTWGDFPWPKHETDHSPLSRLALCHGKVLSHLNTGTNSP
jgi:hypothetical protein